MDVIAEDRTHAGGPAHDDRMLAAQGSPLRQSTTPLDKPIKRKDNPFADDDGDDIEDCLPLPSMKKAKIEPGGAKSMAPKKTATGKGKGKSKHCSDTGVSGQTGAKSTKKRLVAKEAEWNDIPDWGGRTDTPLFKLPNDILDRCFGVRKELEFRDYISLAGTCRFFRHQLNDRFFDELRDDRAIIMPAINIWGEPQPKFDPERYRRKLDVSPRPFSRDVKDWRKEPEKKVWPKPDFAVPAGTRAKWSKKMYLDYKEAQSEWREKVIGNWQKEQTERDEKAVEARAKASKHPDYLWVGGGENRKRVLAQVAGRKDGELAVEKDEKGMPVAIAPDAAPVPRHNEDPLAKIEQWEEAKRARMAGRSARALHITESISPWKAPDSDDEEECPAELNVHYDTYGERKIHDYWPSFRRRDMAERVNGCRVNKTEALKQFKVSEAELLTLKHALVTNPMNTKNPQQAFVRAAVEALALRSHGGPVGHESVMSASKERSQKAKDRAQNKKQEAIRNGTYKAPKAREPTWRYAERKLYEEVFGSVDMADDLMMELYGYYSDYDDFDFW